MLKWTVSRSLSSTSSTPHGPPTLNKAPRRPFRDLSNTPPAATSKSSSTTGRPIEISENGGEGEANPSKRRRCRSHGSDLRAYFQVI